MGGGLSARQKTTSRGKQHEKKKQGFFSACVAPWSALVFCFVLFLYIYIIYDVFVFVFYLLWAPHHGLGVFKFQVRNEKEARHPPPALDIISHKVVSPSINKKEMDILHFNAFLLIVQYLMSD